ncbi:hypothetical protein GOBAR_AA09512 [Gossypium barbadense]|uniref:Uncharacterized protein n=1 Tax=Gossypium barbadense TaxID=3634 RepID=A0A2P5Y6B3_GOSBA|nr:hypothetical protein GOBAR_DD12608 [Gossypium barbadense]PPS11133.1 hypothetical protein GOBAR_AA09512 [Gossypium barbadense]
MCSGGNKMHFLMFELPRAKEMVRLLKEAKVVTSSMFEYLFTLISRPQEQSNCGSWALVSKLLHHKRIACELARIRGINEFDKVNASLRSVISEKMSKYENVEMPRQLKGLELCV